MSNEKIEYCSIISNPKAHSYKAYFSGEIEEAYKYVNLIDTLRKMNSLDDLTLYINSTGGRLDTTCQIINAMTQSKGHITTFLDGNAHSAAALIFLSGHSLEFSDSSFMLCHYFTTGTNGKIKDMINYTESVNKRYKYFFKEIYQKFFTTDELEEMFNGKEFWLTAKDIRARLKNIECKNEKG